MSGNVKANNAPISGNRSTENIGIAVFKNDKLVGELNAIESVCFSIVNNQIDGFYMNIEDPSDEEKYIDLYIYCNHKTKRKVDIINNTPFITLSSNFTGKICNIKEGVNYLDDNNLEKMSKKASDCLTNQILSFLYITSKNYKSDINGFGVNSRTNFLTTKEFDNYNWANNYKNSFFKVDCNINIESGFLITET